MYSSRGPLHPPPGSGQRRAWWCGAENVPAILELFQSFHLHSCSTILLLGPSIFFSQGLTCSNLKGLMLTAKQPEIALHGATYSSVCGCVCLACRRFIQGRFGSRRCGLSLIWRWGKCLLDMKRRKVFGGLTHCRGVKFLSPVPWAHAVDSGGVIKASLMA